MQKIKFKISGLKCDSCAILIEDRLKNKQGVVKVKADYSSGKGVIIFDEQKTNEDEIFRTIEAINDFHLDKIEEPVEDNSPVKKVKFKISGIKCGSCVILIEDRLKNRPGVIKVKVDKDSSKGVVIFDKQKINEADIYKTIEDIGGFKVEKIESDERSGEENINYSNPDSSREVKPPISQMKDNIRDNRGIYAMVAAVVIIFLMVNSSPKPVNNNQVAGPAQNNQQVQQQVAQPSANQQPQAQAQPSVTLAKSDSPELDAFIVSRCPFGLQMQRILADVVQNIPSLAQNIRVRYMGAVSNGTIASMHGDAEAQENLRQICLREEQPDKYWPYISCQMKSGDTSGCQTSTGADSSKLNACVSDSSRGLAYAQKDFDLDSKYQIQGSPTLILNGTQVSEFDFGGRTSDAVKSVICSGFNNQPANCSKKLNTGNAATSFSASYN